MRGIAALAFLFSLLSLAPAFAADPFAAHQAGFGPKIQGLQLGMPMTWKELIGGERGRHRREGAPGTYAMPFSVYLADSRNGVAQEASVKRSGNWILINFMNSGNLSGTIMNGGGPVMSKLPKQGTMDDMFALLKKHKMNYASTDHVTLRDERVLQFSLARFKFNAPASGPDEFAQWLGKTCNFASPEKKGKDYETRNTEEGWLVQVTEDQVRAQALTAPDSPKSGPKKRKTQ